MNVYRVGKVRLQNFGPFKDATLDFAQPGLTVVDGRIDGYFGCDSNGSGKSYLLDSVAWGLFGRCLRERYTGDDIRRHVWSETAQANKIPKGSWTCVTVALVGGVDTVSVARYRKHPTFKDQVRLAIGGVDCSRGTTAETTNAIISTLGMDFSAFCNSVAFAAREDIRSFLSAGSSDTERKKVLEKILGLELYVTAQGVARRRLAVAAEELASLDGDRRSLDTALVEKRALLMDMCTPEEAVDLDLRIKRAHVAVRAKRRTEGTIRQRLARIDAEIVEEQTRWRKVEDQYDREELRYAELAHGYQRDADTVRRQAEGYRGQRRSVLSQAARVADLGGAKCPTCQQTLAKAKAAGIVSSLQHEADDLELKAQSCLRTAAQHEAARAALSKPAIPARSIEHGTLSVEQEQGERELARIRADIRVEQRGLDEMVAQQERAIGQRTRLRKEIQATEGELQGLDTAVQVKRQEAERLEFWVEGFGNRGLKSFLIEAETPRINVAATRMAQRLLGAGAYIRLNATRVLKSRKATREQLSIDAVIPGCTNTYAGASRAQKRRLDLALILALRETVSSRAAKGFRQLFADEVFDGMDTSGTEAVGDLLRELATECPVTLVSHAPAVQALADRVVTVHHRDGVATLRGAEPVAAKRVRRTKTRRRR